MHSISVAEEADILKGYYDIMTGADDRPLPDTGPDPDIFYVERRGRVTAITKRLQCREEEAPRSVDGTARV